jgi:hypothetical protein
MFNATRREVAACGRKARVDSREGTTSAVDKDQSAWQASKHKMGGDCSNSGIELCVFVRHQAAVCQN